LLEDPEVEGGERPVLVDFGLAYLADSETLGRVTQGGEVLGTPYYMAPEQGRGAADIGPPADVYAFGCLLFEMVTGTVIFDGSSATEIVGKQVYSPAPAMSERLDPAGLEAGEREMFGRMEELVGAMLAKEVDARPTAEEVRETCQAILGGEPEWPRGRPPKFLKERSERAAGGAEERDGARAALPASSATVGVVGEVDEDWYVGLGSSDIGCRAIGGPEGAGAVDIIFVVEADAEQVERYAEYGPVLVASDPADFEATRRMLQAGASDMVPRPVTSAKLVEKVERLWRKIQRGRR
jgi:serine/threonine-protein kinase